MSSFVVVYSEKTPEEANALLEKLNSIKDFADGIFWVDGLAPVTPGLLRISEEFGKAGVRSCFLLEKDKFSPVQFDSGIAVLRQLFSGEALLALYNNEIPAG
jgi:hypothetical protein